MVEEVLDWIKKQNSLIQSRKEPVGCWCLLEKGLWSNEKATGIDIGNLKMHALGTVHS